MIERSALLGRARVVLATLFLMWGIDWLYVNFLVATFGEVGYPGFQFVQRASTFRVVCWGIGSLPSFWMPRTVRRPSQVFTWCVYLMVVIPSAVVGVYAAQSPEQTVLMLIAMICGLVVLQA